LDRDLFPLDDSLGGVPRRLGAIAVEVRIHNLNCLFHKLSGEQHSDASKGIVRAGKELHTVTE
jgi:hypothetical protein